MNKINKYTQYTKRNLGLFFTVKDDLPYKNGNWIFSGISNSIFYMYTKIEENNE